jgi:hypothetical protein
MFQDKKKLTKCGMCSKITPTNTLTGVCKECFEEDERLFNRARNAMSFGEKITPAELAGKTGISIHHINRWITRGRFG